MDAAWGMLRALRSYGRISDPGFQQMLKLFPNPQTAPVAIATSLVSMFIVLTTLPMLGGAVGAKLSERRA
jgi:hypothetical protein